MFFFFKIVDGLDDLIDDSDKTVHNKKHTKLNIENVGNGHASIKSHTPDDIINISEEEIGDNQSSQFKEKLMEHQLSDSEDTTENVGTSFDGCSECIENKKKIFTLREQLTRAQNFLQNTQIGNEI